MGVFIVFKFLGVGNVFMWMNEDVDLRDIILCVIVDFRCIVGVIWIEFRREFEIFFVL